MRKIRAISFLKRVCFPLFVTLLANAICNGQEINSANNNPRPGDLLVLSKTANLDESRSGRNVFWDFSKVAVREETVERYFRHVNDTSMICYSDNRVDKLCIGNKDFVFCTETKSMGQQVDYLLPKMQTCNTMKFGDSIQSEFLGKGIYGDRMKLRLFGSVKIKADGYGRMANPDGDTLFNVVRIHEIDHIGLKVLTDAESGSFDADSILLRLSSDSATWMTERFKWYANGYRYPVFEKQVSRICNKGTWHKLSSQSFYFSPSAQCQLIADDFTNETIRNSIVNDSDKQKLMPTFGEYSENDYSIENDGNALTFSINAHSPSTLKLMLSSSQGIVIYQSGNINIEGTYSKKIDLRSLHLGTYLLTILINGQAFSEKVYKK